MRFVDEYRDAGAVRLLAGAIAREASRRWVVMDLCGGHTHAIVRHGLDEILAPGVEIVHGPGCPVGLTPLSALDRAHAIASAPNVVFCSFGEVLRAPGTDGDLLARRAQGADVREVHSPLDALDLAAKNPRKEVVFFATGFEATAPANAMAVLLARKRKLANFRVLVSQALLPPLIKSILDRPETHVQALLGPGHICAVAGVAEYEAIAGQYRMPIVVTGFEPVDILDGVLRCLRQLERGETGLDNAYTRAARPEGNAESMGAVRAVFEVCDRPWRGIGHVPQSGYRLRAEYRAHDAEAAFGDAASEPIESGSCISGQILRGSKKPRDCAAFGRKCTPDAPLGATMVSREGACAAHFAAGRHFDRRTGLRLPLAYGAVS